MGQEKPNLSKNLAKALERIDEINKKFGVDYIGTEHLLYGCMSVNGEAAALLAKAGVVKNEYEAEFAHSID